ncbi:pyridoxal 5'-phosphate synthase glutaminase subunit PdxT [bacterium]|nr:pyridoxal 5'-phosphate synthase glutaminase subunit PdxT [bacterium]
MRVGVLSLQGDFQEHLEALKALPVEAFPVKDEEGIGKIDALIIPGGESTTMGILMTRWGLKEVICKRAKEGMPILGTCAGMVLLAQEVENWKQPLLGLMDVRVRRNAFGRQRDSFECNLDIKGLEGPPFRAIFIRAPVITEAGPSVEVLAHIDDYIVLAKQGNIFACAFHPELTEDTRLYRLFLGL